MTTPLSIMFETVGFVNLTWAQQWLGRTKSCVLTLKKDETERIRKFFYFHFTFLTFLAFFSFCCSSITPLKSCNLSWIWLTSESRSCHKHTIQQSITIPVDYSNCLQHTISRLGLRCRSRSMIKAYYWVIHSIGHVNEYPTMYYSWNPGHTQSMIAYMILTGNF